MKPPEAIVLPGPAILVIPLGLAILATEFVWARKLLNKFKDKFPRQKEDYAERKLRETISGFPLSAPFYDPRGY